MKTKRFLRTTIRTPILIDVLIVTSPSLSDEPNSIGDYYDQLFSALIFRHDWNKNFKRDKKTNLTNKKLEECFSLFSFLSLMNFQSDFTLEAMYKIFEDVCGIKNISLSEEDVCSDIVDGTNLITRDGYNNYVYIHRTIQEYFSAKCIAMFSPEQKISFLNKYSGIDLKKVNYNLMSMLRIIDSNSFYKHYLIPTLISNDVISANKVIVKSRDYVANEISQWRLGIDDSGISILTSLEYSDGVTSKNLKYINYAIILSGLTISDEAEYDYIIKHEKLIMDFSKSEDGKDKFSEDSPEETFMEGIKWVTVEDLKGILPDFGEGLIDAHYSYYINLTEKLQTMIDNEYLKKLESDGLMSNILDEMKF